MITTHDFLFGVWLAAAVVVIYVAVSRAIARAKRSREARSAVYGDRPAHHDAGAAQRDLVYFRKRSGLAGVPLQQHQPRRRPSPSDSPTSDFRGQDTNPFLSAVAVAAVVSDTEPAAVQHTGGGGEFGGGGATVSADTGGGDSGGSSSGGGGGSD